MVYHVVSTKLTEDEHKELLKICEKIDCTPFQFIKESIKRSVSEIREAGILESENQPTKKIKREKPRSGTKKNVPKKLKKSSKSEKIQVTDEKIDSENETPNEEIKQQSENSNDDLMYAQYDEISDVQELIKIYAELREKQELSEEDIHRLTVLHNVITKKMAK